ncbi:MAG TPA: branched-chain amino acid aminotransferase [Lentisphaeria bacterium]|nr:branched-chain amino acid aminotransferase [Lentisphaerota bacterium]HQC51819.1 branched-chain amino acid aminotransferase [Lentisphaeria bacterium]
MKIDWSKLGFAYMDTHSHIRYTWRNGKWSDGELIREPYIKMHIAATALHYGQDAFEGLKVFRGKNGIVSAFRPYENARRLQASARRNCMAEVPDEMFMDAIRRVVKDNMDFVPPYGAGASMYVRPLLIGTGAQIGVNAADEFTFIVMVMPVGAYYKGGLKPVRALVIDDFDRAAPYGTGTVKLGGNYGAALLPHKIANDKGFPVDLYLDAVERKYIEEFGTSNFIAIDAKGAYVTPRSHSVLPSVTNNGLKTLAAHLGMKVEERPIAFDEISGFQEIAACGTAVVITPVNEIVRGDQVIRVGPREGCGPVLQNLYNHYTAIQWAESPDPFGWLEAI